ncbi:MAG: asparagine synthase-related protein [Ignavibacteriota bacterium]
MSWLIAIQGNISKEEKAYFLSFTPEPIFQFESEQLFIVAGGLTSTCVRSPSLTSAKGWIICGTGIIVGSDSSHIMTTDAWGAEMKKNILLAEGQYAGIRWQSGKIEGFVDRIGLRDLYCFSDGDRKIFSTRLDWVSALQRHKKINFRTFGSRWLTFTQLSMESLLHGVERIKPQKPFEFPEGISTTNEFNNILTSLTYLPQTQGKRALLGMSGGLDSRLLLSLYSRSDFRDLDLFTFGASEHPDVKISKQICTELKLRQKIIFTPVHDDADFYIREISGFLRHSNAGRRASAFLQLGHYDLLRSDNTIVIDGAFGELARRQLLNRLLLKGRSVLFAGNADEMFRHLKVYRSNMFSEEIQQEMERGAKDDIQRLIEVLPKISIIGPENWVDLFAIRSIVPNVLGYEQSRTDHYVQSFMPFVQPSLLEKTLLLPLEERRKGKLFRKLIAKNAPVLTGYPLVRHNISYPYNFSALPSYLWMRMKQKAGMAFEDPSGKQLLMVLKEYILDRMHSKVFIDCPYYDHKKIIALAENFYSGNDAAATELDWWLAFELWRSNVEAFNPIEHR